MSVELNEYNSWPRPLVSTLTHLHPKGCKLRKNRLVEVSSHLFSPGISLSAVNIFLTALSLAICLGQDFSILTLLIF